MRKKRKVELLAPAGSMAALKAAVAAGCDAVYLGLQSFSARAFAGNFSHEEFEEAVRFCHIHGVKVYVTINTMLFESELENAKKEVQFLYEHDADALLIQDPGLFRYVRNHYPDFDIHCSTQMHIHNLAGVKFMRDQGAKRVVLARESPIELIREASKLGIDIEVFVYGAICISYSGQCLMSAAVKNRSANRGMCAQCCRLQYYPDERQHFKEGDYILSPKDLNIIDRLPELINAGAASLKIEGRMKRPEYVWLVTRTFREAIDAYEEGKPYHVSPERMRQLLLMFNRGFSEGHLFHASVKERMSQKRPNHQGVEIGKVTDYRHGRVQVKLSAPLYQHDGLRIINEPHDTGLTAVKIEKNGRLVSGAKAGDLVWLECHSMPEPKKGQSMRKTTDTMLLERIDAEIAQMPRIPVSMKFDAVTGELFRLTMSDGSHEVHVQSASACEPAKKAPLNLDKIQRSLVKLGDSAYEAIQCSGNVDNVFLPVSVLNEVRRQAVEQMDSLRAVTHERSGYVDLDETLTQPIAIPYKLFVKGMQIDRPDVFCMNEENTMPVVDENNTGKDGDGLVLSSLNDLYGKHAHCIGGMTMNIANSEAIAFMLVNGCDGVMLSSEMDESQIEACLSAFEKKYGFRPYTVQLVYGKRTVMYIKNGFSENHAFSSMVDKHHQKYDMIYEKNIVMILEPEPVRSENKTCSASLVLLNHEKNSGEIVKEAYEEISG